MKSVYSSRKSHIVIALDVGEFGTAPGETVMYRVTWRIIQDGKKTSVSHGSTWFHRTAEEALIAYQNLCSGTVSGYRQIEEVPVAPEPIDDYFT